MQDEFESQHIESYKWDKLVAKLISILYCLYLSSSQ